MSPLFETVRAAGGEIFHAGRHNARMNASRRALFGAVKNLDLVPALSEALEGMVGAEGSGLLRCRIEYGRELGGISVTPYVPRTIRTLRLVEAGGIRYAHKFTDRRAIDSLLAAAGADEILMVRNGLVTDASAANVAFFDGASWLTPAAPLLPGTTRARLLEEGILRTDEIRASEIARFERVALMNAMLGFDPAGALPVSAIR